MNYLTISGVQKWNEKSHEIAPPSPATTSGDNYQEYCQSDSGRGEKLN